MSKQRGRASKHHQVYWTDLEAWVEQLYEDHHARLTVEVVLVPLGWNISWGVRISIWTQWGDQGRRELYQEWRAMQPDEVGVAESLALQMASRGLLELEQRKERAERQAPLL